MSSYGLNRGSTKKADGRTPVQQRSQRTRQAIIVGASVVFDQKGYAATSLKDISDESGVSLGSIYFYFQNKDQLAHAVISEQHSRSYEAIMQRVDPEQGPVEQLIGVSRAVVDQLLTDPIVRAGFRLGTDEASLQEAAQEFYEAWARSAQVIIERAQVEKVFRNTIPAPTLARLLIGFFSGTHLMSQATTERSDLLQMIQNMWIMIISGQATEDHAERLYRFVDATFTE